MKKELDDEIKEEIKKLRLIVFIEGDNIITNSEKCLVLREMSKSTLISLLEEEDEHWEVRKKAAKLLKYKIGRDAVDSLIRALEDSNSNIARTAGKSLRFMRGIYTVRATIKEFEYCSSPYYKEDRYNLLIHILSKMKGVYVTKIVIRELKKCILDRYCWKGKNTFSKALVIILGNRKSKQDLIIIIDKLTAGELGDWSYHRLVGSLKEALKLNKYKNKVVKELLELY